MKKELIWIIKTEMNAKFPHHTDRAIATVFSLFIIPFIVGQTSEMRTGPNSSHLINTILQVVQVSFSMLTLIFRSYLASLEWYFISGSIFEICVLEFNYCALSTSI
jgi:hypothetical protein